MTRSSVALAIGIVLFGLSCTGDPAGPRGPLLALVGASPDSLWVGTPGTPVTPSIGVVATDFYGRALPGASIRWGTVGKGASVSGAQTITDAAGRASGTWVLGTSASEVQELHITVATTTHVDSMVIRAKAVPSVVSSLEVGSDTMLTLRVGDTLALAIGATDPYGNHWIPAGVVLSPGDTAIAVPSGNSIVARGKRGIVAVKASIDSVSASCLVHVTQFVSSIVLASDTIRFTSLGVSSPLSYTVLDDRHRTVKDTTGDVSVADTAVVAIGAGVVRSRGPGNAAVTLRIGGVTAVQPVVVRQRVIRLQFASDSVGFQALADTTRLAAVAFDSAGFVVAGAYPNTLSSDTTIVAANRGLLRAIHQGTAQITGQDPESGVSTTIPVTVQQTPTSLRIDVTQRDGYTFTSSAGDSIGQIVAADRNGFALPPQQLTLVWSDTNSVGMDGRGVLRARRSGISRVHVVAGALSLDSTFVTVLRPQVAQSLDANFAVAGFPDSLYPWAPTAVPMPDGSVRLYFAGYVPDSINTPPIVADLHYAVSTDSVHFTYGGVALKHDSSYSGFRSLGLENVDMVPRDDGPGCRLFVSGGSSWWIWQIWSAVAPDCKSWQWENGPALPGVIENDTIGRPTGEGMTAWQDSTGGWWMLAGVYPPVFGGLRTWTIGLFHGTDQRHWTFVNTAVAPGPPGSGMNRAVYAPTMSQVSPGLYRMFFTGDNADLALGPGSSFIFSAVSRDRLHWEFEGMALDLHLANQGPRYATIVGNHLYFVVNGAGFGSHLASVQVSQP